MKTITGKEAMKRLEAAGFAVIRINGSHHFMRHPDGRATVVPLHGNKPLKPGTQRQIERDVGFRF
ncbi:MAG: type II toxin-antitoxin system HicA family toxin [Rhodospirillaceae bacterium]